MKSKNYCTIASEVENCNFKTGISIAVALPKDIIIDLQKAPTKEYYDLYYSLNKKFLC